MGDFGPTASILRYFSHICHVFSVESVVFAHEGHICEVIQSEITDPTENTMKNWPK